MGDKKKRVSTLDTFVFKKQRNTFSNNVAENVCSSSSTNSPDERGVDEDFSLQLNHPEDNTRDIVTYIGRKLTVDVCAAVENIWYPCPNFKFPSSGKRNLKFQFAWFHRWTWLAYSKEVDGAFCKFCVFFANDVGGIGGQPLKSLVKKPFTNWKDAVEVFNNHQLNEYHKLSVVKSQNVTLIQEKKMDPIILQVDDARKNQIEENRQKLVPIVDTVILCGRQNIPLRGHRDSGLINIADDPIENDGNFRAILRSKLRSGDKALQLHLETMSKNATYLSSTVQNEIIHICGQIIVRKIVTKLDEAKFFSVLADECTDVAGIEQFSLCIRFFNENLLKVEEHFIQFVPVADLTGQNLSNVLLQTLRELQINCMYLVGQGYDGASSMSGAFHGAQAYVRKQHKTAMYVHCASHSLNLAISDACDLPEIRNCLGVIGKICNFLKTPKRQNVLESSIEQKCADLKARKLKTLCNTRWVERHDSVITFLEMQEATIDALSKIQMWKEKDTSSDAHSLLNSIETVEFQTTLRVIAKVFSISLPLSKSLQSVNLDLGQAISLATVTEKVLLNIRENVDAEFSEIFNEVKTFCNNLDIDIKVPRTVKIQTQRNNVPFSSSEDYYKKAIFIPFLDSFILHLHDRLSKHRSVLSSFQVLFKREVYTEEDKNKLMCLFSEYKDFLDIYNYDTLLGEAKIWQQVLCDCQNLPKNAIECLILLKETGKCLPLSNVFRLLKIYVTLPVTTSSNERSFSTLRRLKTYLRSTTEEKRLNGLALLNIHREIPISVHEVIDEMSKVKRKLPFVI